MCCIEAVRASMLEAAAEEEPAGEEPVAEETAAEETAAHISSDIIMMVNFAMHSTSKTSRPKGAAKAAAAHSVSQPAGRFGAAYFRKYYLNPATRVVTSSEMRNRATLIAAVLSHLQIPVRSILDAGCGIGLLRRPFAEALPRARYVGLEFSEYLCRRYGWQRGSVASHEAREPFDLLVCYDVLQYLGDAEAARAIANFAHLSRAALYFSALTREDWRDNCDRSRTDRAVHVRSGAWYRRRLGKAFRYVGFGVWLRKDVSAILWDLER
jgi:predicted TPR repeat methyltransferase